MIRSINRSEAIAIESEAEPKRSRLDPKPSRSDRDQIRSRAEAITIRSEAEPKRAHIFLTPSWVITFKRKVGFQTSLKQKYDAKTTLVLSKLLIPFGAKSASNRTRSPKAHRFANLRPHPGNGNFQYDKRQMVKRTRPI